MSTVADILRSKGTAVFYVAPEDTVLEALRLMAEKNIGGVPVLDDGRLVGIFTERDYARKGILAGRASRETVVRDVMTPEVRCVRPSHSVEECMGLMTRHRIRHLPVLVEERVAGIVTIGDTVKALIDDQQFQIEQLEHYITSGT